MANEEHFSDTDVSCLKVVDDCWFSGNILILEPFGNSGDVVLYHDSPLDFSQITAVNFNPETGRVDFVREGDKGIVDSGLRVFAPTSLHLIGRDHILLIQLNVDSGDDYTYEKRCMFTEFCGKFSNVFRKPLTLSGEYGKVKKIFPMVIKKKLLKIGKEEDSVFVRYVQDLISNEEYLFRRIPPDCVGQLFSPDQFDIYCDLEKEVTYIFHSPDISQLNISRLEFHTKEFWVAVILPDGNRLDLGSPIHWLVRGNWLKAKYIFFIRTIAGKAVSGVEVPKVNLQ